MVTWDIMSVGKSGADVMNGDPTRILYLKYSSGGFSGDVLCSMRRYAKVIDRGSICYDFMYHLTEPRRCAKLSSLDSAN